MFYQKQLNNYADIYIISILKMSDKNSKLVEYLQNQNHEMAITAFNHSQQNLSDHHIIELARAFIINDNYKKSYDLSSSLAQSPNDQIKYQATMLAIKSMYLMKQSKQAYKIGRNLLQYMKSKPNIYTGSHCLRVKQIMDTIQKQQNLIKAMAMNKNQLRRFGQKFMQQLEIYQNQQLSMGMPMFLVSQKWFDNFKLYCGIQRGQEGQYPGIITHFEIIDDRYNAFNDPTPQKQYTNYFIYPSTRIKCLPKSCWLMLKQIFIEIHQLKRFNISILGSPRQIITEIYLKRLKIKKDNNENKQYILQISRKQTYSGVINKLKAAWKVEGYLKVMAEDQRIVQEKNVLEEDDTMGKVYKYIQSSLRPVNGNKANVKRIQYKCNACGKADSLKFCQCKSVKYCDMDCLRKDREKHRKKCELEMSHLKQKAAVLENFHLSEKNFGGRKGLVGLKNLGNTCYMNSGLQCLSNTKQLTEYFMSNNFLKDINHTNPLGTKGNLACAYAELIRQMWAGNQSYLSPFNLKKIIGKFATQFSGFGQQDSQELISYLVDGLQQDLNLVKHKQTFEVKDQILPDQQASRISQQNYAKRIQSYIRNLMVGQYKSTVICSICHKKSICFDPYMLVTLPVPTISREKQVYFVFADGSQKNMKMYVEYDNQTSLGDIKKKIMKMYKISGKDQQFRGSRDYKKIKKSEIICNIVCLQKKQTIQRNLKDEQNFAAIIPQLKQDEIIMFYELVELEKDQSLYQVEILHKDNRINFPKYANLNPSMKSKELAEILAQFFARFYQGSNPLDLYESNPEFLGSKVIIRLRKNISLLKCKSQSEKIRTFREKTLNLEYCLKSYGMTEILQKNNQWYCNSCKKFVKATKQMQIYKSNKILVLAFKRFSRGWKIKHSIDFPLENLNMAPYLTSKQSNPIYDLYGVVNHYGTMYGGHYTAFCKNFINQRWYEFDDSRVSEVRSKDILSARQSAYVLFYRRRDQ